MRDAVPPPFPSYEPGTFAEFTVHKRLPKILSEVRGQLAERHRADPRWDELSSAVTRGGPVDASLFAADTPYWAARIAALRGRSWSDLPFFDLEFFFYKAIDTIVLDVEPGLDVFAATRHESLIDSLPQVARSLESRPLDLETAFEQSVSGNEADLSQITASGEPPKSTLLVDERADVIERLRRAPSAAVVHFLADNAGSELCFDLVLVEKLLELEVRAVELHVKPSPMFVSDALGVDVDETVSAFERCSPGVALVRVGRELRRAMRDDRLRIRAPRDWAEPRHIDALEPELSHALHTAYLVLVKGDLNYRRYFGDRAWPAHTPVEMASLTDDQHAFGLRVLKSDCVVGIPAADVERLSSSEPDWRVNRKHAIVQRIDRGPRGEARSSGR